ncbi:FAD-dependent monooxygenase [Paenarthrobacter sp. NPDC092416]|uniref:FAD-dependent monooxygenase n=1 Tax=Paenarthrobacter sp. NPDC092416 TaxID=3364386 RepID=UPI003803E9B6
MKNVEIIGGGIAGLALALQLDPARFDVTVHEQRPELPAVGTTLAMWPEAQKALAGLGILDAVRNSSPVIKGGALRNAAGKPWMTVDGKNLIGVSRHTLLSLLDAAVPATVRRETGRVPGLPSDAFLVVGADGVHSMVRRSAWGEKSASRITPYLAVRGVLPEQPAKDAVGEYWGRGDLFGIGPSSGGTNWYASFRTGLGVDGVDVDEALHIARGRFADHSAAIRHVLSQATPETSLAQRIWTAPPLRNYARDNAVLIGDAAHAMAPNLGRGACESLVDAVTLGTLLNTLPLEDALNAYDRQRVRRTQRLRIGSSLMMRVALAEGGRPLRDALLDLSAKLQAKGKRKPRTAVDV